MPRAPSSDVGPAPFPPLAAPCTSHPWDFAQFKVCCFPQTDSPRGQGNWGSFAVGQEASRAGRGRGWGWTPESLSLGQLIGFPLYQEEQEPCTPTPTPPPPSGGCSPQHILHPAPCPWLHRFPQRQRERAFSFRSKCFFLPFSLPWKLLFLHLACQLQSWGKGETLIPS